MAVLRVVIYLSLEVIKNGYFSFCRTLQWSRDSNRTVTQAHMLYSSSQSVCVLCQDQLIEIKTRIFPKTRAHMPKLFSLRAGEDF